MDPVTVRKAPDGTLYTVPVTPESQERLDEALKNAAHATDHITDTQGEVVRVAAITLGLAKVRALIPGRAGTLFETFVSGTGRTETGAATVGPKVAANFAPAPVGYTDSKVIGQRPNFLFPAGTSFLVPEQLDFLGFGSREQRADDEAARLFVPPPSPVDQVTIAVTEFRAASFLALTDAQTASRALDQEQARIVADLRASDTVVATDPFATPPADGSFLPETIEPVNDAARRNQAAATGIRRMLVSERADP